MKVGAGGRVNRLAVGLAIGGLLGLMAVDLDLPSLVSFWADRSFLVPAVAVACALLWLTPARRLLAVGTAALALCWLAVAFTPLVAWMANGLVRRDALRSGDAVFVFASRLQSDGEPTAESMARLQRGLELLAEGRAKNLVVSELASPSARYAPLARAWVKEFAPGARVFAVGPVANSRDEAVAAARLCRAEGWSRVLAVSSPVHTRRAAASLERQGLAVVAVPSIETRYDLETFDLPGDRLRAFGSVAHERIGLFVYRRRGWI